MTLYPISTYILILQSIYIFPVNCKSIIFGRTQRTIEGHSILGPKVPIVQTFWHQLTSNAEFGIVVPIASYNYVPCTILDFSQVAYANGVIRQL